MRKAFTILELVVVIGIIVFFTALILPNYRLGGRQLAIQRSAHKLSQDLRRSQEMAMSSKEVLSGMPDGFGIYFDIGQPDQYILFADFNNSHNRDGPDADLETIKLESAVKIANLSFLPSFSVVFAPPDPTVWINNASVGTEAKITLSLKDEPGVTKVVSVNSAGLIYAQ